jgi:carbamoyltransferase
MLRHGREPVEYQWNQTAPVVGMLYTPALEKLLGPTRAPAEPLEERHHDIARSVQAVYEQAFFTLLRKLHRQYRVDALTLAGGCAMNSVANGKITLETPFRKVYIQPAAGDAGGALGAALESARVTGVATDRFRMDHAYWGPGFSDAEFEQLIRAHRSQLDQSGYRVTCSSDTKTLCAEVATSITEGQVVGWFQGRMEWGPRALGNRSILCDPRRGDMKAILNAKIKRRESFRPFAPSILREEVARWFEIDDDEPFMMKVFQIRPEKRLLIPAITHVDGSGRLQTVTRDQNPVYHDLIRQFFVLTGVPMLLNTSFNENEPIVCRPEEALDCFLRTRMDLLVLGNWQIRRIHEPGGAARMGVQ